VKNAVLSLVLPFLYLVTSSASALAVEPYRILVTSFDPFGLSSKNNSQPIAKRVAQLAAVLGEGVQVDVCNLPVVFDNAAIAAHECVDQHHPNAVISLGEGGCDLQIETSATNWDASMLPDNAGQSRAGRAILEGGPHQVAFEFPVQAMFCAVDADKPPVTISTHAGAFVCNNTAYHLSQDLSARGIPFTFIHVPHSRCSSPQKDVEKNAQVIAKMLHSAIAELRSPVRATSIWMRPGATVLKMPANRAEAQTIELELQSSHAPACEQKFAHGLVQSYHE
jgi:pyroglutamyl-peptidase